MFRTISASSGVQKRVCFFITEDYNCYLITWFNATCPCEIVFFFFFKIPMVKVPLNLGCSLSPQELSCNQEFSYLSPLMFPFYWVNLIVEIIVMALGETCWNNKGRYQYTLLRHLVLGIIVTNSDVCLVKIVWTALGL
jgi:hypothetical protein